MPKYCPDCGTENNNNSTFCRGCGKSLSRIKTGETGKNNHSPKFYNRNKVLIIIILILITVLAISSVYILYNNSNNNDLPVNNSNSLPATDNSLNNISKNSEASNVLSKTMYFTAGDFGTSATIGHGDTISLFYSLYEGQMGANTISIAISCSDGEYGRYYKLTKATVYYENSNGKTITKTYSGGDIYKKVPDGYTPIKAVVYYEKK